MSDGVAALAAPGVHEIVWFRGPDSVRFLDGLVSQDIAGMAEGTVAHSFLLAPNGKLRAPLVAWRGAEEIALITTSGAGEIVSGDLTRFKIRVDVEIERESRPVVTVVGDDARPLLASMGHAVPTGNAWASGEEVIVGAVPFARGGPDRVVTVGLDVTQLAAAGTRLVTAADLESLRIERGEPLVGRDVGDSTIPQEMGDVEHAVSFTKGCYLGQELVARIDSRGHVNRHLRAVVVADGDLPPVGAELVVGEKVVGNLSSVSRSERLGKGVGMALIRREVGPGDIIDISWDGGTGRGEVRELPLD